MRYSWIYSIPIALGCASCTIWTSETPEQVLKDDRAPRGVHYALPKGVVKLTLTVVPASANYTLTIDAPTYIPDMDHSYYLRYRSHPSYSDDVRVFTNKDGFLTRVAASTTDQTPGIILNLVKAAVGGGTPAEAKGLLPLALEANEQVEVQLLALTIDPLDLEQRRSAERDVDKAVVAFRDKVRTACGFYAADDKSSPAGQSKSYYEEQRLNAVASKPLLEAQKDLATTAAKTAQDELVAKRPADAGRIECNRVPPRAGKMRAAKPATNGKAAPAVPKGAPAGTAAEVPVVPPVDAKEAERQATMAYCDAVKALGKATRDVEELEKVTANINAQITTIDTAQSLQDALCPAYVNMNKPPRARIGVRDFGDADHHAPSVGGWKATVASQRPQADCTIGVCYRPKEPYRIEYSLGGGRDSLIAQLPNAAEVVAIDIRRAFLVQKLQDIRFDNNGFLSSLKIEKGSELLAASLIPVNVLTAIGEGLQARINITSHEKDLTESETALAKARAEQAAAPAPAAPKTESGAYGTRRTRRGASSGGLVP